MSVIENIKQTIGRFYLMRDRAENVQRFTQHFDDVKTIGILYEATRENMEIIGKYANRLRNEGKTVFMLGYFPYKELTFDVNFTMHSEYIHRQNLTWTGLPKSNAGIKFKNDSFDLLLNLYNNDVLPLFYISLHSKAKFRIGKFEKINVQFFDMMVDMKVQPELPDLIKQIDFYIHKL